MNYHLIKSDDMLNGEGLRITLFLSGCEHHCENCHNPQTHDVNSGELLTEEKVQEIIKILSNDYITGITLSGGDPLHSENVVSVYHLLERIKSIYKDTKDIWIYTGYIWEDIYNYKENKDSNINKFFRKKAVDMCNILVDGRFISKKSDVNYCWAGSTNQRIIDVQKTLQENSIILWDKK